MHERLITTNSRNIGWIVMEGIAILRWKEKVWWWRTEIDAQARWLSIDLDRLIQAPNAISTSSWSSVGDLRTTSPSGSWWREPTDSSGWRSTHHFFCETTLNLSSWQSQGSFWVLTFREIRNGNILNCVLFLQVGLCWNQSKNVAKIHKGVSLLAKYFLCWCWNGRWPRSRYPWQQSVWGWKRVSWDRGMWGNQLWRSQSQSKLYRGKFNLPFQQN